MLNWVKPFNIFCFLDNNEYPLLLPGADCLLAVGVSEEIEVNDSAVFDQLSLFAEHRRDWLFGHIAYPSNKSDSIHFPKAYFFVPQIILKIVNGVLEISSMEEAPSAIFNNILAQSETMDCAIPTVATIENSLLVEEYLLKVEQLKKHIQRGDCYEINFCQEFFSTNAIIDPFFVFHQLQIISPNPFASLYKLNDKYCLCASPERFIKKTGNQLISQPMKGTLARNINDVVEDNERKTQLAKSEKDRSENVMVVDLVRNDFSKICDEGSVTVSELFGIYSFPNVHQMISTVEGRVAESVSWPSIIEACFPMGSMTGAPKKRVMELIEQYEKTPRGLFSGSIGYVTPDGDFDFNVVIRSLFYNQSNQYLSFKSGGGITNKSDALQEYHESMLKAKAIRSLLE